VAFYQCYTWTYQLNVPPFDRLMDVLDAFFSAYPKGEYAREGREAYKLVFRRGMWKRFLGIGPVVPARLVPGDFSQWPVVLHVLARPSPEKFLISLRYEVYLPRDVKALSSEVQNSVHQHIGLELHDLAAYLAECMKLGELPQIAST
jgi:hypothetical protein